MENFDKPIEQIISDMFFSWLIANNLVDIDQPVDYGVVDEKMKIESLN